MLATLTCLLTSCASIQVPPPNLIAKEGAHATAVAKFGPVFFVRTVTVLPGKLRASERFSVSDECSDGKIHVVFRLEDGFEADRNSLPSCAAVLRGLKYAVDMSAMLGIQLSLTVDLVGSNKFLVARSSSLATATRASARYAFALDGDSELLSANVVSTTAHETFHLLHGLRNSPEEVGGDERLAYTMGACAQLDALGWVRDADLPSVAIPRGTEGVSSSVAISNIAGISVKRELDPFMQGGVVRSGSINGLAMKNFCLNTFR